MASSSSNSANHPLSDLYNAFKPNVWIVKVTAVDKAIYFAGVCVNNTGLVLTSAHWTDLKIKDLKARPVDKVQFNKFDLVQQIKKWGVCLIQVRNVRNSPFASFGSGLLSVGDAIYHIGHQGFMFGSFSAGTVTFPCVEQPIIPNENSIMCQDYTFSTMYTVTPLYRIAGHIWRSALSGGSSSFEKQLSSELPVIQCGGLVFEEGSLGGPLLDCNGKLVVRPLQFMVNS